MRNGGDSEVVRIWVRNALHVGQPLRKTIRTVPVVEAEPVVIFVPKIWTAISLEKRQRRNRTTNLPSNNRQPKRTCLKTQEAGTWITRSKTFSGGIKIVACLSSFNIRDLLC